MRKAFTLVELMVSIVILSIMMLFLYKSYSGLGKSNKIFEIEVQRISKHEKIKELLYLDFALAKTISIQNQDNKEDVVFLQTLSSVHRRIKPYVAYILKNGMLYRLESLRPFIDYPLAADSEFVVDELGEVKSFRVYPSRDTTSALYLIHIVFQEEISQRETKEILLKVKSLNRE